MKLNKSNMKKILILIFTVFLFIPIILMLFGYSHIYEKFDGYNMDDKNTNIDALDIDGVTLEDDNGDSYTGKADEKLYCIGGNISCDGNYKAKQKKDGEDNNITDDNGNPVYQCINDADIINNSKGRCSSAFTNLKASEFTLYPYNDKGLLNLDNSYNIKNFSYDGETTVTDESKYYGFTNPYQNIPLEISGSYVYVNNDTDIKYSACFFYESGPNCNLKARDTIDPITNDPNVINDSTDSTNNDSTIKQIKCNADNGAKLGDDLCCGQTGVVQYNSRICPVELPKCTGYVCGEQWGTCGN